MRKLVGAVFSELGINYTSAVCLRIIMLNEKGVSAGELSETGCCDKALVSRTIKDLSEKGYVCRNPDDRRLVRGYRIMLTEKGRELASRFDSCETEIMQILTEDVSHEDLERFYEISEHISDNLYELANKKAEFAAGFADGSVKPTQN
jgi:DNA-binding MarR family transcriptional regulator